jgi:membrane associated rhomboid family serine protease
LGTLKFLIIYFAGGILGSIVFLLLPPSAPAVAVGASGAIFALGGVLAVMRPRLRVIVFPIPVPLPLWIAIIGIFVVFFFIPSVAWQAHLGGLVLGLVAGYIFRRRERRLYY